MPAAPLPPWLRTFDPRRPEGRSRLLPLLALAEPADAAEDAAGTWTSVAPGADAAGGERYERAMADARRTEQTWASLLCAAAGLAACGGLIAARRRVRWWRQGDHAAPFALDPVPVR